MFMLWFCLSELSVEIAGPVMEGQDVKLSCKISCDLEDNLAVIWRKNDQYLQTGKNELVLQSIRKENEGGYSCALKDHDSHPSKPVALSVMCK